MYKRILFPFDGSANANAALTLAVRLAREGGGLLRLVYSLDPLTYLAWYQYRSSLLDFARAAQERILKQGADFARSQGAAVETQVIEGRGQRVGDAVAAEATRWNADLIVVGTHGRHGISRALLGSGAEQVIRMAPVPVLIVR